MGTHYAGTPQETLALDAFIKLMRATESIGAYLARHIEAAGLTMGQFGVMEALLHLGPMGQRDLGAKLLRSGSNVTMVLDNLERRGLVRRTRRTDDRRAIEVTLTGDGKRLITALFPQHARRITLVLGTLTPRDQTRLGALCKTLGRNIPEGDI